jgi:hypothetical protein
MCELYAAKDRLKIRVYRNKGIPRFLMAEKCCFDQLSCCFPKGAMAGYLLGT